MTPEETESRILAMRQQQQQMQQQEFYKFQLDVTEELATLKWDLLGYEYDEKSDGYVISKDKMQMINTKGANAIVTFLRPRITRIISLSNQEEEQIFKRCLNYMNDLTFMLCRHKDDFEIESFAIMDNIIDLCDDVFNATALKSVDGWEGDSIRKGHTNVESKETIIQADRPKGLTLPFVH
jgi:hypothetical protein